MAFNITGITRSSHLPWGVCVVACLWLWWCTHRRWYWHGWSQQGHRGPPSATPLTGLPWWQLTRLWCGKRSCPLWTPHRCPSSPHPHPRTAHPCPLSADAASCWVAVRGAGVATADLPARLLPPSPSPRHPAEGRLRGAALAGWTESTPAWHKTQCLRHNMLDSLYCSLFSQVSWHMMWRAEVWCIFKVSVTLGTKKAEFVWNHDYFKDCPDNSYFPVPGQHKIWKNVGNSYIK